METNLQTKTIQAWIYAIKNNEVLFNHPLQRREGQWNAQQQAKFIRLLLKRIPLTFTYAERIKGNDSLLDGIQRFSTLRDFIADEFALASDTKSVIVKGQKKEIAGKKFSELDEPTQQTLLNEEMHVMELVDASEEDILDLFEGLNSGKSLNAKQMRTVYENKELRETVRQLAEHEFIKINTTLAQKKNATDRDIIRQSLMLICTDDKHDYTSFRKQDIDAFLLNITAEQQNKLKEVDKILSLLDKKFNETKLHIPATSIPVIIMMAKPFMNNTEKFEKYCIVISSFSDTYKNNKKYRAFGGAGTTDAKIIKKRIAYLKDLVKDI